MTNDQVLVILACAVIVLGIYMAVKGNPSMVRERLGSGVSPENEREFMMTIGGAIGIIGLDLLVLALLALYHPVSQEIILVILGIGIALFAVVVFIGQRCFRR